jgi:cytochrome c oxidase subunit 1
MAGHPRRIAFSWDEINQIGYTYLRDVQPWNELITVSAILLGLTQILFFANIALSLFRGRKAGPNPWRSASLEWVATSSPPPRGNWGENVPVVHRGPYEYTSPDAGDDDFLPQTAPPS